MALSVLAILSIIGCEEEPVNNAAKRVRAIKPYTVSELADREVRRYSGTIIAANTTNLSFTLTGTVTTVVAKLGDRVKTGQVLATLDPSLSNLNVQAAKSQLAIARAKYSNKKGDLDRKHKLFTKGWVTKEAIDQAVAASDGAEGEVNLALSRLGSAERDLEKTHLVTPFDGVIASRDVEPFMEVSGGQSLFSINSEEAFEIILSVPDTSVTRLSVGIPITVNVSTVPNCGCQARITEISPSAGAANAVLVTAALLDNPAGLIPGMTAEAVVVLTSERKPRGFLVPLVAIAPGNETVEGYLYKYDTETNLVSMVAIRIGQRATNNLVEIVEGVKAGDIIAAAGVSFLRDGQRVKLLNQFLSPRHPNSCAGSCVDEPR